MSTHSVNPQSKTQKIAAYINASERPLSSAEVMEGLKGIVKMKDANEASRLVAGVWKNRHFARVANDREGEQARFLYVPKGWPGGELFGDAAKQKGNGKIVGEISLDGIPNSLSPAKKAGPKPKQQTGFEFRPSITSGEQMKAIIGDLILSTAEAIIRKMK
jgi:hypothetical protein